jgi:hypothetical protein
MISTRHPAVGLCLALALFLAPSALAETIDRVVVNGTGLTRESAIENSAEIAVQMTMERYVRPSSLDANADRIRYRILDESQAYLKSLEVLDEAVLDDGIYEVRAKVLVDVGKLATSLRNLQVTLRLLAPGADQAVEGRRRAPKPPQGVE